MITIRDSLIACSKTLTQDGKTWQQHRIDAECLLAFVLNKSRVFLLTYPEHVLSPEQVACFNTLIAQRKIGTPIAYLTGNRSFWSFTLQVTPAVLIPRPETELLVEHALLRIQNITAPSVLELGTGSGAIALAIASERSDVCLTAIDHSQAALEVALNNAQSIGIDSINFCHSDWFSSLPQASLFHLIVANPPYLAKDDPHLEQEIRFEPQTALVSGPTGLEALHHIIQSAPTYLHPQGWLCLEHGYTQASTVRDFYQENGYQNIQTHPDLQGLDRVTLAQAPQNR